MHKNEKLLENLLKMERQLVSIEKEKIRTMVQNKRFENAKPFKRVKYKEHDAAPDISNYYIYYKPNSNMKTTV